MFGDSKKKNLCYLTNVSYLVMQECEDPVLLWGLQISCGGEGAGEKQHNVNHSKEYIWIPWLLSGLERELTLKSESDRGRGTNRQQ